jgi:uncharacterized protein DUF4062
MPRPSAIDERPLLIDRAAAAEIPSPQAIREWAGDKRVFISSVMSELRNERQETAAGIRAVGARPIMFEEFGRRDADPEQAYLAEVESSDIYAGILGRLYGKPLKSRFSATHAEYLHAEKSGLRMAIWTLATDDREGHEQSFLDEVRTFYVVPGFRTPTDLRQQIEERSRRSLRRISLRGASSAILSQRTRVSLLNWYGNAANAAWARCGFTAPLVKVVSAKRRSWSAKRAASSASLGVAP